MQSKIPKQNPYFPIHIEPLYINLPIGAKAAAKAEFEIMINAVDENFIFVFVLLLTVVFDILSIISLLLFLLH